MLNWLLSLRLDGPGPLIVLGVLLLAALGFVLGPGLRERPGATGAGAGRPRAGRRRLLLVLIGAVAAGAAWIAQWLLIDVADVLGIPVGPGARAAWTAGIGLAAIGVAAAVVPARHRTGRARRLVASALVPLALLTAAVGINDEAGYLHTLADLAPAGQHSSALPEFGTSAAATAPITESQWQPPADQPATGAVFEVQLPGEVSGFAARDAQVYLPPAALTGASPLLPVIVLLSGQPGTPSDMFRAGQFQSILDDYAAAHHGLAPIVVSPDQLGDPDRNPLCADTAAGSVRTYLETDVPAWIEAHLPVSLDRTAWTFGGFSQGGTCAYQLGLDQPERYGQVLSIAGEAAPSLGTVERTIAEGFGGDQAAYEAATPAAVLAAHTPYHDLLLQQAYGETDTAFGEAAAQIGALATAAGIDVRLVVAPGSGHDFTTVAWVLRTVLPELLARSGMTTDGDG